MEKLMQDIGKVTKKFDTVGKVLDYLHEEVTPTIFKEKTEEVFEVSQKAIQTFLGKL